MSKCFPENKHCCINECNEIVYMFKESSRNYKYKENCVNVNNRYNIGKSTEVFQNIYKKLTQQ